ncbi:MAG TPA: sigma-70 family RNA polymerase sigma factor [Microlunatus sp.]|nr:sigma-70 family RNA polymerase sigma factor [Microlunatus sp.]
MAATVRTLHAARPELHDADRLDDPGSITTQEGPRGRELAERTRLRLQNAIHSDEELQAAREAVIADHLWLARAIANRFRRRGEDFEDLMQVACTGLVEAACRYDPGRGDFVAFAAPTINGLVKRHFRDHGWLVRPSRRTQELVSEIRREWSDLAQELGHLPSNDQLAERLGETTDDIAQARSAAEGYRPLSIDLLNDGPDRLGISSGPDADRVEARLMVQKALRSLDPADRELIRMRFYEGRSQSEIAGRIGTSQMQVSRRLSRLFARLRDIIGGEDAIRLAS